MSATQRDVAHIGGGKKEQIRDLLGAGCSDMQVAAAVGCDRTYINQLMQDEDFAKQVVDARLMSLKDQSARDGKYDGIEDRLLEKLESALPMMMKPDMILRSLQIVNAAKRRGATNDQPIGQVTNIINLTLPDAVLKRYQVSGENNVIEVDGQPMIGMTATRLMNRLKDSQEQGLISPPGLLAKAATLNGEPIHKEKEYAAGERERLAREQIQQATVVDQAQY